MSNIYLLCWSPAPTPCTVGGESFFFVFAYFFIVHAVCCHEAEQFYSACPLFRLNDLARCLA